MEEWRQYLAADRQLRRLEKAQRQRAGSAQSWDAHQFLLSPTCPPSTSIVFRGGDRWYPPGGTFTWYYHIPSYSVNLADANKVSTRLNYGNYTCTFSNAYWYVSFVISLNDNGLSGWKYETWPSEIPDDSIYLVSTRTSIPYYTEFETAAQAEQDIMDNSNLQVPSDYGTVVGGIVLRNNGTTGIANQYMPIDLVNRGRSYLFWQARCTWEMG